MTQVVIQSIGFLGGDKITGLRWAKVPRGDGSVEGVPMSQISFLGNKLESGGTHDKTLIMLAFIVRLYLVSLVWDLISVAPLPSDAFIGDVSYILRPAVECCSSLLSAGANPQPS